MINKKVVALGRWWVCENMDLLSPIAEEGVEILYNDGTREFLPCMPKSIEWATYEEKKIFGNALGTVFAGDVVDIVKGIQKGAKKTVKGSFTYIVKGTYGHADVDYLLFEDGTKTNILNCEINGKRVYRFADIPSFSVGGRR